MAILSLLWFGGMAPRYGEQHLSKPHATEAENCNLYSGELRPLTKPAKAYVFCRPGDPCYDCPTPDDPSDNPELPPEPPKCIPVAITVPPGGPPVQLGGTAQFVVEVTEDATGPIYYQWYENNELIPGAVFPVLNVDVTADNLYSGWNVEVRNPCGYDVSNAVRLNIPQLPQCFPYSCSAYDEALILAGYPPLRTAKMWTNDIADFPYPFATSSAQEGLKMYLDFLAAPSVQTDWGGSTSIYKSVADVSAVVKPAFCEGAIVQMGSINSTGTGGSLAMVAGTGAAPLWGDYTTDGIIIGRDITGPINVALAANSGKTWVYKTAGNNANFLDDPSRIVVYLQSQGNDDVLLSVQIRNDAGWGGDPSFVEVLSPGTRGEFHHFSCSVSSGTPYAVQDWELSGGQITRWALVRSVTVTASYAGVTATSTKIQPMTILSGPPQYIIPGGATLYTQGSMFNNPDNSASFLSLSLGEGIDSSGTKLGYERTFVDYTPPPECNT